MQDKSTPQTRVVHIRDNVPGAVYIGRAMPRQRLKASPFANPYRVDAHGRQGAIELYRGALMPAAGLIALLPKLRGKPLACWCRHDGETPTPANACHGDVLVDLLNTYTDDELLAIADGVAE